MGDCAFDHIKYANSNSDLKKAYGLDKRSLQIHYLRYGINERRSPCGDINPTCTFNPQTYINNHEDLKRAYETKKLQDPTNHYHKYGIHENRIICKATPPPPPPPTETQESNTYSSNPQFMKQTKQEDPKLTQEQQDEVMTFFSNFLSEKVKYVNKQIEQVQDIIKPLLILDLSNTANLVSDISVENTLLDKEIEESKSKINRSSIVKWKYQDEKLDELKYQNYILYIIFYILVCVLGTVMYFFSDSNMVVQVIVFHVLLVWPFIIYYFELIIYTICKYIYAYSYGIPYEKVYFGFT